MLSDSQRTKRPAGASSLQERSTPDLFRRPGGDLGSVFQAHGFQHAGTGFSKDENPGFNEKKDN